MVDTAGIPSVDDLPDRVRYDALPVCVIGGTVRGLVTAVRVSLNVHS